MKTSILTRILIAAWFITSSCSSPVEAPKETPVDIGKIANDYYEVYAQKTDFEKFLSFYDDQMVLEDMINGDQINGVQELANFFDWGNPNLSRKDSVALVVREHTVDGSKVVTEGYFTPFSWGTMEVEAMQFTTILTFNSEGKIVKHVDWINYPATLVDYANRKNSNDWIK